MNTINSSLTGKILTPQELKWCFPLSEKAKKCVLEQCRFCPMKIKRTFCESTKKSEDELVNFTKDYINWYVSKKWVQQLKKRNSKQARF